MSLLSTSSFDFSLRPRRLSGLLIPLALLMALAGSAEAVKIATAAALSESTQADEVRKGLALDPDNAALCNRLSQLCSNSLERSHFAEAVALASRATALNPNKADYWLTLASACESVGYNPCAGGALEHSLALSPMVPSVWWMAGNQYLRARRSEAALSCFRHLLNLSPDYAAQVFDLTLRTYGDSKVILENIVSGVQNPSVGLAFADFLSANDDFSTAYQAWTQAVRRGAKFPFVSVQPYLARLLNHGRYPEAQAIWVYLELQGIVANPAPSEQGNLVFNGGFENQPLGGGFDWNLQISPYDSVDFADSSSWEGKRCLHIEFPVGQNIDFEPVYQIVPVLSTHAYDLSAYIRSSDITSDSGPRLRVTDPDCPSCLDALTDTTVGTTPWHWVTLKFTTGPQTQAVRLSVWRPRSRTFPMDISGGFWLDGVSISAEKL